MRIIVGSKLKSCLNQAISEGKAIKGNINVWEMG